MSRDRLDVLERFAPLFEGPELSFEGILRRRDRKRRNQRIAAGVVGIAIIVAPIAWIIATGGWFGRTQTPAATPLTVPPESIIGLPPEGATPSMPEHGELVLNLEGSTGGPFSVIWAYADGRLVWHRQGYLPEGGSELSTGLLEQRLTPEGVEFLRSEIISTGMFGHDLELKRVPSGPFLSIQARNGDRLVRVTWAWRGALRDEDAPRATAEQASALEGLHALLTDPASWPASVWEDRDIREFVPSRYSVCIRRMPKPIESSRIFALLPEPAGDLLRAGVRTQEDAVHSNGDCFRLMTEDARALAQTLDAAGLVRTDAAGEFWLRYELQVPGTTGTPVLIHFAPVLPHGEATWWGAG